MADPLSEYQKQMMARGLGGIFQEEGPRLGSEYVAPGGFPTASRLAGLYESRLNPKSGILYGDRKDDVIDKKIASIFEKDRKNRELNFNPDDIVKQIQTSPLVQPISSLEQRKLGEKVAEKIEAMPDDSDIFSSALDEYAASIAPQSISGPKKDELILSSEIEKQDEKNEKVTKKYGDASAAEEFRAKEAQIANLTGARTIDNVAPKKPKDDEIKDLFMSGVDEYMKVLGKEVPPEIDREEALKKYKNEFAEATGIDISGKPDTSAALMSLGLALMQNRAGSGFNVGRILSEVGKAGEKALPMFQEAKKEAKAAAAAAGKYALQMIKSDEDARDAIKASNAAIKQELILKNIDAQNSIKEKILEARLKGKELSVPESIYNEKIKIGTNEYNIRMGIEPSSLNSVFVNPVRDVDEVASAYKKTVSGLDAIEKMEDLTQELINISEGQPGGLTTVRFLDKAQGVLKSMGLSQDSFFSEKEARNLSIESEIDAVRRAFIMRFKRFISQETGNGISNVDVAQIKEAAGQLDGLLQFTNPEQSLVAFGELRQLFNDSLNSLDPIIDDFGDRRNYYEGSEGDELYNRTLEKLSTTFGQDNNLFMPTVVENADGSQSITYDVRSG